MLCVFCFQMRNVMFHTSRTTVIIHYSFGCSNCFYILFGKGSFRFIRRIAHARNYCYGDRAHSKATNCLDYCPLIGSMDGMEGFLAPPLSTGYLHKRAPGSWKVHYTSGTIDKVRTV